MSPECDFYGAASYTGDRQKLHDAVHADVLAPPRAAGPGAVRTCPRSISKKVTRPPVTFLVPTVVCGSARKPPQLQARLARGGELC
jgi:hypothetical protein